jgi:hypothetical protein
MRFHNTDKSIDGGGPNYTRPRSHGFPQGLAIALG